MSENVYVECCQQMVPRYRAMPFHYSDKLPVYLCYQGYGCTTKEVSE